MVKSGQPAPHRQFTRLVKTFPLGWRVRRDARRAVRHKRLVDHHRELMVRYRERNRLNMRDVAELLADR